MTGGEPVDGHPVLLEDWISHDGLTCLKIKLRGDDAEWDYRRVILVGEIAVANRVEWLSTDFNCTVTDPAYVTSLLDRLRDEYPRTCGMILYVETDAMQFYPAASLAEQAVHPGIYRRRDGRIDLSTVQGTGFGYRLKEIDRALPVPVAEFGR